MRTAAASTRTRSAGRRPAPSHGVSCVCDDASRRERRRPRARGRVVSMAWTRSTPSTRRRRVAPMARDSLDTTDAGRGAPVLAAAAGEDAGQEVQDAHVPLRRGHVPLRRELLLRAQRRSLPRGKINSSRRRREKRVGRAQEELRPREPDEPPGEPTDGVSRLERLRALRDSRSLSAAESGLVFATR